MTTLQIVLGFISTIFISVSGTWLIYYKERKNIKEVVVPEAIKENIKPVLKEVIDPVETKIDTIIATDRFNLYFYESLFPGLIINTLTSEIISANIAFCEMVKQPVVIVEKKRFLTYIDPKGLKSAQHILESMRQGVNLYGEKIIFKPNIVGEITATGNGNMFITIVPDIKEHA